MSGTCWLCGRSELEVLFRSPAEPVLCTVLWRTAEEARASATGPIELVRCRACGFVFNRAFDGARIAYSPEYHNALHHSAVFRDYEDELARGLVERHALAGARVVEVGAGDGHFLARLCELGGCTGVGYDPAATAGRRGPVELVSRAFDPSERGALAGARLLVARHVLEHIPRPTVFVKRLAAAAAGAPVRVYAEVPSAAFVLSEPLGWDVTYEHCSYFSPETLALLFERAGFHVLAARTCFGEQYAAVEAELVGREVSEDTQGQRELAARPPIALTATRAREALARWQERLRAAAREGPVVLWGAGAKAVVLLNRVPAAREAIAAVVDQNPAKQGRFVSGSGHPIVAPERLRELAPAHVLVVNGIYEREVSAALARLGVTAQVSCVIEPPCAAEA